MSREVEVAVEAARAAGAVLRRGYGTSKTIRYKATIDLVTAFDEESERTIIQILSDAFPTYGFWTEESGHHPATGDARWIVDPLDGTTNYAHDFPHFAVSIALEKAGMLVAGVVYDPIPEELVRALLATGPPSDHSSVLDQRDYNAGMAVLAQGLRQTGSAALDMCYVAAGRLDGYFERGMHLWDIGAGMVIVAAAGGSVSTYAGTHCDQGTDDIVASNGLLHPALLDLVVDRDGGHPPADAHG